MRSAKSVKLRKDAACCGKTSIPRFHNGRRRLVCLAMDPVRASIRGGAHKLSLGTGGTQVPIFSTEAQLPFSAVLEYVEPGQSPLPSSTEPAEDIIEITYVLSGMGHLKEARTGTDWPLMPGTSLITWANSTYLAPHSPHQSPQTEDSPTHDSSEPLAVIKFHFPISVLDPHTPTTTLSRAQREALAQAWGLASPLPRSDSRPPVIAAQHGVLSDSEALSLLQATGARTQSALLHEGQLSPMMLLTDWHNNQASASTTHHIQLPTSFAQQHTVQPAASQHSQSQPRSRSNGHHQRRTLLQRIHMRKQSQMASHITSAIASPFRALSAAVGLLAAGVSALWQESERAFAALHALVATPLVAAWTHLAADATARGARDLAAAQLARPLLALLPVSTGGQTAAAAAAAHMSTASSALGEAPLRADGAMRRSASPAPTISVPRTLSDLFQAQLPHSQCVLMARTLEHFKAFRFPKQTNQLAFVFDPLELGLSLSFGVEIFEPGHHTPLHVHRTGHELFFVLSGEGDAFCDGQHIPVQAGDCIVFPPGSLHGLDNNTDRKLYALQMMCPDDEFVAYVQSGTNVGSLADEDICQLTAKRC